MQKIKHIVTVALTLLSSYSYANHWVYFATGGAGVTTVGGHSQNLDLANTPSPGLINKFASNYGNEASILASGGVGYAYPFTHFHSSMTAIFNLQAFIVNTTQDFNKGIVHPQVNVSPTFDTLNYHYKLKNYGLVADIKWFWQLHSPVNPYLDAGVGVVWNRMYDYRENPTPGSTAAPMLFPFRAHTRVTAAYQAGTGIIVPTHGIKLLFGYRFMYLGHARLNTTLVQTTTHTLKSGPIFLNVFTLSVMFI